MKEIEQLKALIARSVLPIEIYEVTKEIIKDETLLRKTLSQAVQISDDPTSYYCLGELASAVHMKKFNKEPILPFAEDYYNFVSATDYLFRCIRDFKLLGTYFEAFKKTLVSLIDTNRLKKFKETEEFRQLKELELELCKDYIAKGILNQWSHE